MFLIFESNASFSKHKHGLENKSMKMIAKKVALTMLENIAKSVVFLVCCFCNEFMTKTVLFIL